MHHSPQSLAHLWQFLELAKGAQPILKQVGGLSSGNFLKRNNFEITEAGYHNMVDFSKQTFTLDGKVCLETRTLSAYQE